MVSEDSQQIAWAAGLFEGEGFLCTHRGTAIRAGLSMTDRDVVERFAAVVGCGHVRLKEPQRGHWKAQYLWNVCRVDDVRELIHAFWPYLGERRRKRAAELLAHAEKNLGATGERTHCPAGHPYDEANTYITPGLGYRRCRACHAVRSQARRDAARARELEPQATLLAS